MKILTIGQMNEILGFLLDGKVGVLPTDTIYGLHCLSSNSDAIKKIYEIKQRPENMPYITLISSVSELEKFGISLTEFVSEQTSLFWPGPNTLTFKTDTGESLSFRVPNNKFLLSLLQITGPLVSTSANIHKHPVAKTSHEAFSMFGDSVDFYVDGGELTNPPSSIYQISDNMVTKIR